MASTNSVRIRLRYPDLDTFVEKFGPNVTRGGVFLASRNIQPVGATVPFEIQLASGEVVLAGQGKVTWVKEFNPAEPTRPYGMGMQFISVDPATKPILARVLQTKEAAGGPGRRPSGQFATVGAASQAAAAPGGANGRPERQPVDTSVDLAAEYGVDEEVIRRVIDQTWMSGARGTDDLGDLMKPSPVEPATLEQALAELPRLLDPQYSRRRASGGFRPTTTGAAAGGSGPAVASTIRAPAEPPIQAAPIEASEITDMSDGSDDPSEDHKDQAPTSDAASGTNGRRNKKKRR